MHAAELCGRKKPTVSTLTSARSAIGVGRGLDATGDQHAAGAERGAGNHADDQAAGRADGQGMDLTERGSTPNWVKRASSASRAESTDRPGAAPTGWAGRASPKGSSRLAAPPAERQRSTTPHPPAPAPSAHSSSAIPRRRRRQSSFTLRHRLTPRTALKWYQDDAAADDGLQHHHQTEGQVHRSADRFSINGNGEVEEQVQRAQAWRAKRTDEVVALALGLDQHLQQHPPPRPEGKARSTMATRHRCRRPSPHAPGEPHQAEHHERACRRRVEPGPVAPGGEQSR